MSKPFTLTTFTPGEAERITGLSTTMQRDWRRRNILPATSGHARFDVFSLAEMWVLKMFSDRGIGPEDIREIAPMCAAGIVWNALQWGGAYEGDHERTFEWLPPSKRPKGKDLPPEMVEAVKRAAEASSISLPSDFGSGAWGAKRDWLARQVMRHILREHRMGITPHPFENPLFVSWADGTSEWLTPEALAASFGGSMFSSRYSEGPVIILEQVALANALAERAGRPLVHVEFATDPKTGRVLPPAEAGAAKP
jgi:hypothetical protein